MQKYKIPQNVQIEDKIFGNILTLKQLIIIGIGGAISYILYTILIRLYTLNTFEIGLLFIPAAIAVAFSFININQISLFKYMLLLLEFLFIPRRRVWDKRSMVYLSIASTKINTKKRDPNTEKALTKTETLSKLDELTRMLDSGNQFEHLNQPELKIDQVADHKLAHYANNPEKDFEKHHARIQKIIDQNNQPSTSEHNSL